MTTSDCELNPVGFTTSSVTSLGSTPPLIYLNISQGASSYPHISTGKLVAVHTLDAQLLSLAQKLAGPKEDRFLADDFEIGPESVPIFTEASSVMMARVINKIEVESNAVVILALESAHVTRICEQPLVYFQRGYHTIGARLQANF